MNKLVTIGIPAFNRPLGLRHTLESICGQTYINTEIFVSDNCSTNTDVEQVAREFCAKDSRVKYFRQPENLGPYGNFAFLVHEASGEFFMIASDDDGWDPDYVEKLVALLDANIEAVMSVSEVFFRKGNSIKDFNSEEKLDDQFDNYIQSESEGRILSYLQNSWDGEGHFIYGVIRTKYAKNAFREVLSYYNHPIATDWQIIFFLICCGPAVVSRDTKKYYYFGDTISANFNFNFIGIINRYMAYKKTVFLSNNISKKAKHEVYKIISKQMFSKLLRQCRETIAVNGVAAMKFFRIHKFYQTLKARLLMAK